MVERSRRAKGKRPLLGNHQRCWIWGRRAVWETLKAARWKPWEVRLSEGLAEAERDAAAALAERQDVPVVVESPDELKRRCRSSEHQGYLAKMPPFPYQTAERLLESLPPRPLCAILDAVQDPYNFGAILRSADVLGVDAVFVGKDRQSPVTSLVARTSAGAVNWVPLAEAGDLVELARCLSRSGVAIVAATEQGNVKIDEYNFIQSTAVVIGNEGSGVRPELLAECHQRAAIPQIGHVGSLNAAVSAAVLFYEARRQRLENSSKC